MTTKSIYPEEAPNKEHVKELYKLRNVLENSETRIMDLHLMYSKKVQSLKKELDLAVKLMISAEEERDHAKKCGKHWQKKYKKQVEYYNILAEEYESLALRMRKGEFT